MNAHHANTVVAFALAAVLGGVVFLGGGIGTPSAQAGEGRFAGASDTSGRLLLAAATTDGDTLRQTTTGTTGTGGEEDEASAPSPETLAPIGINLARIADWETAWPFVDVMKTSRPWIPQKPGHTDPWDTGETLITDRSGWPILQPGQAATTLMWWMQGDYFPGGRYTVTYEGKGKLGAFLGARMVGQSPGRAIIEIRPPEGRFVLKIQESDPTDHIRNMRVWIPGYENHDSYFHPLFVERLRPFKVIRYIDWMRIIDSPLVDWQDRPKVDDARWSTDRGVPIEVCVALSNELGADMWICMPHMANDGYVENAAQLVLDTLDPNLNVYLEYSNECWNGLFAEARWAKARAEEEGISMWEFIAKEAQRDFRIWHRVWGDQKHRVKRVAAGQMVNPWIAKQICTGLEGEFDCIAPAAYFSPKREIIQGYDETTTSLQMLMDSRLDIYNRVRKGLHGHKALAESWSDQLGRPIDLVTYEGGQHLSTGGANKPYLDAMIEANRRPEIATLYRDLLRVFNEEGGSLLIFYNYCAKFTRYGSWGHLEYQDQPLEQAHKYRALIEYIEQAKERGADWAQN
jgi:hypothetical protein